MTCRQSTPRCTLHYVLVRHSFMPRFTIVIWCYTVSETWPKIWWGYFPRSAWVWLKTLTFTPVTPWPLGFVSSSRNGPNPRYLRQCCTLILPSSRTSADLCQHSFEIDFGVALDFCIPRVVRFSYTASPWWQFQKAVHKLIQDVGNPPLIDITVFARRRSPEIRFTRVPCLKDHVYHRHIEKLLRGRCLPSFIYELHLHWSRELFARLKQLPHLQPGSVELEPGNSIPNIIHSFLLSRPVRITIGSIPLV